MKGFLNIDEIWAWTAIDKDGTEGIVGVGTRDGWLPLVGADRERAESCRSMVQEIVDATGVEARLKRFSTVEVVATLKP